MHYRNLVWLLTLTLIGCGGGAGENFERALASGTVELGGKPITQGSIRFIPIGEAKGPAAGAAIKDGKYHFEKGKGPIVGKHRVVINAYQGNGELINLDDGEQEEEQINIIPERYNMFSELQAEIKPEENNGINFSLDK